MSSWRLPPHRHDRLTYRSARRPHHLKSQSMLPKCVSCAPSTDRAAAVPGASALLGSAAIMVRKIVDVPERDDAAPDRPRHRAWTVPAAVEGSPPDCARTGPGSASVGRRPKSGRGARSPPDAISAAAAALRWSSAVATVGGLDVVAEVAGREVGGTSTQFMARRDGDDRAEVAGCRNFSRLQR